MNKNLVKFIPIIITFHLLILHLLFFHMLCSPYSNWHNNILIILSLYNMGLGYICGKIIKRLYDQSFKDNLTNTYNRNFMHSNKNFLNIIKNKNTKFTLLLLDIDNLKMINDTYGHFAGDDVIREIAKILINLTRTSDYIIRWGGDEFLIVLCDSDLQMGYKIANRIKEQIQNKEFTTNDNIFKTTVSVGLSYQMGLADIDKCISNSDCALYKAKEDKNSIKTFIKKE